MQNINLPWVESPYFKDVLEEKFLSDEYKNIATDYNKNGFVVLSGLFSESLIDGVKKDMDEKGFNPDYPKATQNDTVRVQDLWQISDSTKQLATEAKVLEVLKMLYGREPIPFQTLNFKTGTQQRAHSDTIHFSSIPARFMCGVWVALEDVTPDNGAVFYYPGSHKNPEYNFSHFKKDTKDTSYEDYIEYEDFIESIMKHDEAGPQPFYAKKGDTLIWSSNIIHGGSKVTKEGATRYSQVTHYYFKDCIYYTPMLSNMVTNELCLREELVDIKTGQKVTQSFNGSPVKGIKTAPGKAILNNRLKKVPKFLRWIGKFR